MKELKFRALEGVFMKHKHEWVVYSTAVGDRVILVECNCGLRGVVEEPSKAEWGEAFYSPSKPYRWTGGNDRVCISNPCPKELVGGTKTSKMDALALCKEYKRYMDKEAFVAVSAPPEIMKILDKMYSIAQQHQRRKENGRPLNSVELTEGLIDKLDWNLSQEEFDLTVEYFNNSLRMWAR